MRRKVKSLLRFMGHRSSEELSRFAEECGTKPVYLYQIAMGYRRASHVLAQQLDERSDGEIPKEDTRPDIWEASTQARAI